MTTLPIPRRERPDNKPNDNRAGGATLTPPLAQNRQEKGGADSPTVRKKAPAKSIYYPTGDGKPMAEDVLHRKLMAYSCDALELRFALRPDVHVAGNDFLYYEEGNPKARISPDCYVVFGVQPKPIRHFYKVWEEQGITPAVVFEFTSKKTKKEDVSIKRPLYEQTLRVQEYFQFDPTGDYLRPRLQGQRLDREGVYQPIELRDNRMRSEQLGLELVVEGETLRFYDPATSEFLRTYEQAETQRVEQELRAEEEAQRAQSADQRAEQETRRAEQETRRAQAADRRAEEEAQRAEGERLRAEAAEAQIARLRQELDALRKQR